MPSTSITVLLPAESESWEAFTKRLLLSEGEVLIVLSGREEDLIAKPELRTHFFKECKKISQRLRIATKHPLLIAQARAQGIRVLDRTKFVKQMLAGHPQLSEALRVFSPHLWRQQLTSRMQRMGLLSMPRLRIYFLVGFSVVLFLFVVFRLLPSAEVRVVARQEPISQTMNIFLVQSGAIASLPARVHILPITTITVSTYHTITFDHISKEFIGKSAQGEITIVNTTGEDYSFRKGTRFSNQAGMVFRTQESSIIPAGKQVTVKVKADDLDLYNQIIGERGNVPAGVKWDVPGLSEQERKKVYGENRKPLAGGTTAYRTVLKEEDLELARKKLEEELITASKELAETKRVFLGNQLGTKDLKILDYPVLTKTSFSGVVLPTDLLGKDVPSITVQGGIVHTVYAYDREDILKLLASELQSHVRSGKRLLQSSIDNTHLDIRVIDYNDDLSWIKLTVELLGTEEYILDPLSPDGALFGKRLRDKIAGMPYNDALKIVKNMQEVDNVEISVWPPWSGSIPSIPAHISIDPQ